MLSRASPRRGADGRRTEHARAGHRPARAGGLGFLAGGYRTAQALAGQIHTTRAEGVAFGVNLCVPNPVPVSHEAYRRYAQELRAEADRYGLTLPVEPIEGDDHWTDKIDLLTSSPVP